MNSLVRFKKFVVSTRYKRRKYYIKRVVLNSNFSGILRYCHSFSLIRVNLKQLFNKHNRQSILQLRLRRNHASKKLITPLRANANASLTKLSGFLKVNYYAPTYKLNDNGSFLFFLGLDKSINKKNGHPLQYFINLFFLIKNVKNSFKFLINTSDIRYYLALNSSLSIFGTACDDINTLSYSSTLNSSIDNLYVSQNLLIDVLLIRFFTKRSNLIKTSRRLSMPKIMRKAIITGSKLSVDTYALNYFSHKIFLPASMPGILFRYSTCLSLKDSLTSICRLPSPSTHLYLKQKLRTQKLKFILPKKYIKRKHYKIRLLLKKLAKSNTNKKIFLINRFFRKKKTIKDYFRQVINTAYYLNLYRFRLINPSVLTQLSYFRRSLPKPRLNSYPSYTNTSNLSLLSARDQDLFNKFFHQSIIQLLMSPMLAKLSLLNSKTTVKPFLGYFNTLKLNFNNNLKPVPAFKKTLVKKIKKYVTSSILRLNITPWYHNTIIRFFEYCSGNKVFLQYYLSIANRVDSESIIMYKRWMPRMASYERKLGHRFFLEEALHIMHLSFRLHDASLIASWLKAMIKRISFWKTRSIFRFMKYLFNNYLESNFNYLGIKGFKVKLKGKISAAGNSRKRNIIFRSGKTSYSSVNLKCVNSSSIIPTFTGVMGFQVWLFY